MKQAKFFFFWYTGPTAALRKKASMSAIKTQVLGFFSGLSGNAQIANHSELTEAEIIKKLDSSRGSHKPSGYEFGTGSQPSEEEEDIEARLAAERQAVIDAATAAEAEVVEAARLAAEEAVATEAGRVIAEEEARVAAEIAAREAERQRKIASLPTHKRTEIKSQRTNPDILGFDFSELVNASVLEELADVDAPTSWVAVQIPEDAPKSAKILSRGAGGPAEIVPVLLDSAIIFGAMRVTAVDRKGTRVSLRARIVYFIWTGEFIDAKTRFRNTAAIKAMKEYFVGTSLELKLNGDKSELSEASIAKALAGLPGATGEFRFGVYDRERQADDYAEQMGKVVELKGGKVDEAALSIAELAERERRDRLESEKEKGKSGQVGLTGGFKSFIPKIGSAVVAIEKVVGDAVPAKKWATVGTKPATGASGSPAPAAVSKVASPASAPKAAAEPEPVLVVEAAAAAEPEPEAIAEAPVAVAAPEPEPVVVVASPVVVPAAEPKMPEPEPVITSKAAASTPAMAAPAPATATPDSEPETAPAPAAKKVVVDDSDDEPVKAKAPVVAAKKIVDDDSDDEPVKAKPAAAKKPVDDDSDDEPVKPKAAPAPAPAAAKKVVVDDDSDDEPVKAKPVPKVCYLNDMASPSASPQAFTASAHRKRPPPLPPLCRRSLLMMTVTTNRSLRRHQQKRLLMIAMMMSRSLRRHLRRRWLIRIAIRVRTGGG